MHNTKFINTLHSEDGIELNLVTTILDSGEASSNFVVQREEKPGDKNLPLFMSTNYDNTMQYFSDILGKN